MLYQKKLDVKYDVDVFIAGGGAAGVAAAIACARGGKSVFLAEASGCFGGLGTTGMVPSFAPFDDGKNVLASGIGYEIRKKVSRDVPLDAYWTPIHTEELKRVYDEEMKSSGALFSFFTKLCDVCVKDGHVEYVILSAKSGMFAVKAKMYIDCTGDGDLCAFGGGKFEQGDKDGNVMPSTLCSLWSNIGKRENISPNKYIEEAYRDGVLTYEDRHLPGFFDLGAGMAGGNLGHVFGINPTDERELTQGIMWGRKSMTEYEEYFKRYFVKGYENMTLCSTGSILGVRESRRITCDYTLCADDFIKRADFDDEIGRYCYPVDIHVMTTDKKEYERFENEYANMRYEKGESYGIPYRSLVPVSFSNVLVAGRCIGTDRSMQASVRVMPGCFITGQAAGAAAALCADKQDARSVDAGKLKDALRKIGAYVK